MNDENASDPVVEDTAPVVEETPAVEPVAPAAPVEEPVKEVVVSTPTPAKPTSVKVSADKESLRVFLNAASVRSVDDVLFADAITAIEAGKIVKVITVPPFLEITNEPYTPGVRHAGNFLNDVVVNRS